VARVLVELVDRVAEMGLWCSQWSWPLGSLASYSGPMDMWIHRDNIAHHRSYSHHQGT